MVYENDVDKSENNGDNDCVKNAVADNNNEGDDGKNKKNAIYRTIGTFEEHCLLA